VDGRGYSPSDKAEWQGIFTIVVRVKEWGDRVGETLTLKGVSDGEERKGRRRIEGQT